MNRLRAALLASCALVILLNVWGTLAPGHWNWGCHIFGFIPPPAALAAAALAFLLLVAGGGERGASLMALVVERFPRLPAAATLILLWVILGALALLIPARLHLLGDGALLLRVIGGMHDADSRPPNFDHQPLVGLLFKGIQSYFRSAPSVDPVDIFRVIDGAAGAAFLALLAGFIRSLRLSRLDRLLSGAGLFFAAGSQFFLGYVELYTLLYVFITAYVIAGWRCLEGKLHPAVPVLCFAVVAGLHYAAIFLLPGLLLLLAQRLRIRPVTAALTGAGLAALAAVLIAWGGIAPEWLRESIRVSLHYNFLPAAGSDPYFPYALFSAAHIADWFQANLLIAPFGLAIALTAAFSGRSVWKKPVFLFLSLSAVCGLAFTFVMNPALGLARDWDFLASFFIPLLLLDVYCIVAVFLPAGGRGAVVSLAGLSVILWSGWVGLNAGEGGNMRRIQSLNEPALLGTVPRTNYNETLANYFWFHGDVPQAKRYWEEYAKTDSTNPRTVANLSEVYRRLGDTARTFHWLERAVRLNTPNAAVYMNLGVMYAQRKDTVRAIELNRMALARDSMYGKPHGNLGILYLNRGGYSAAARELSRAIELGVREPFLYREAARAYFFLNDFPSALRNFDAYLELAPDDRKVRSVRDQLKSFMEKQHIR